MELERAELEAAQAGLAEGVNRQRLKAAKVAAVPLRYASGGQ